MSIVVVWYNVDLGTMSIVLKRVERRNMAFDRKLSLVIRAEHQHTLHVQLFSSFVD